MAKLILIQFRTKNFPQTLGKWPTWCTIPFYVFIFIFNSLNVSSTLCSSSGETNCVNTTSGSCHSEDGWVICVSGHVECRSAWPPTQITHLSSEWQLPGVVLTQSLSLDDEHNVLDTCRELKMKIHRKELCITLVIYQGSLHDAQSTKYKLSQRLLSSGTWPWTNYVASNQETATWTFTAGRPPNLKKEILCFLGPNKGYQCFEEFSNGSCLEKSWIRSTPSHKASLGCILTLLPSKHTNLPL